MTNTGALITGSATALMTVGTQAMPLWMIVSIGVVGGFLALLNQEEINYKTIPTYIISGAMISASGTNAIVNKFFSDSESMVFLSIGIAFILGILGHILVYFILENKKGIRDKLQRKLFDNQDQNASK